MSRIFVIDDDEQLLRMVGLMLERGGHTVTLINNPLQGIELLEEDKPDLLVLDVMMPDLSGHDLTRQIRSTKGLEELPILILTARSQDIDRTTALKSGADGYLSKPVTSQELIKRVDELLSDSEEPAPPTSSEKGIIISFYALRGGVGCSTLAVNLALALRQVSQEEVCFVDLSPSASQALLQMRLKSPPSWEGLLAYENPEWPQLKEHLLIQRSGLRLLAGPSAPRSPDKPSATLTQRILQLLQEHMTFVVVDAPPVYNAAFQTAIAMTDIGLHVVTPEILAVQTAVHVNRALVNDGVKFRQKSYILNQVTPKPQLPVSTIERGLNSRVPFQVGFDGNQARALAQGVPLSLANTDSPLATVIKRMANVIWQRVAKQRAGGD